MSVFPRMLNAEFHTKFKIVGGYPGGNEVNLAMESGEVQGRGAGAWTTWKHTNPDWVRDGKIIPILQIGPKKDPSLPNVPLLSDLAQNPEQTQLFQLIAGNIALERPFVAPPHIPADRLEILRKGFADTTKDPEFLAEAEKMQSDVDPAIGEQSAAVARSIVNNPPEIIEKAKAIVGDFGK
jgi:hypothetical protein